MASRSDIPLPEPTLPRKRFTSFRIISFDIYGTLIDWETGIISRLKPLLSRIPDDSPYAVYSGATADGYSEGRIKLAAKFNDYEHALQTEQPDLRYDKLLAEVYPRIARDFGDSSSAVSEEADEFGQSVGEWLAFPDTVDACQRLSKHYRLVPLSNVSRKLLAETCAGPLGGVSFWRVYTAEDIGSYKPDLRNFHYLLEHLDADDREEGGNGIRKDEILHVAQSLQHDHIPAKAMGMSSVWINRKGAGMGMDAGVRKIHDDGRVGYGWKFGTLGEFADEVERQFGQ